jgi:hypothetical protein
VIELRAGEASPEAVAGATALLAEVFPRARHLDLAGLTWDYLGNPLGRSLLAQGFDGDRIAAHLAGRRLRATLRGAAVTGVLVHHAATHAAFRRRGLLLQAIEALLARAHDAGAAFALAVVNRNSVRAFVGAGGFVALQPLTVRLALGSLRLGAPAESPVDFAPHHDPGWLAWRLAAPGARYAVRRSGPCAEIWSDSGLFGVPVLLGDVPSDAVASRLPDFASRSPLRLWAGRDPARRLAAPLSVALPLALRPSPLHLVFRPLEAGGVVPAPDRVRFDGLDFDAW